MDREYLASLVRGAQSSRIPSISVAVQGPDGGQWQEAKGMASVQPPTSAATTTSYRVGSITKTFTAALALQLHSAGVLALDDRLSTVLPNTPVGTPTFRQLLSHSAGVSREIPTGLWRTFEGPSKEEFLASLGDAEQVLPPGTAWHYSNMGYSLVGAAIEALTGQDTRHLISERFLVPLELSHTGWHPPGAAARGYWVHPEHDRLCAEPEFETGSMAPASQLWSTPGDLVRWGRTLAGHHPDVLAPEIVAAMHRLAVLVDPAGWSRGWGLGLDLRHRNGMTLAGHDGIMPGFVSCLTLHRESGTVAAVAANASTGLNPTTLADQLVLAVAGGWRPAHATLWRRGRACPAEYLDVLGLWWSEGERATFRWRDGRLEGNRECQAVSRFEFVEVDLFRCTEGPERGERLRIVRASDGTVAELDWAGYPYSRRPYQERYELDG